MCWSWELRKGVGFLPHCPDHSLPASWGTGGGWHGAGGHSLWKKRDKHTEKNRVRTDVIWGLPEEREFPGSIRGSKSVLVPSGQKGSHASPSFTRQLQSCPNIHTTDGTTFDLEVSHVSKVTETAEWQRPFELLPAPANQTENAGKLSFLYVRLNSSCRWDRI